MSRHFEELTPQNFSFNSPLGWCPACQGLGTERGTDAALLVGDPQRSLWDGAISAWPDVSTNRLWAAMLRALGREFEISLELPFVELEIRLQRIILHGGGERWVQVAAEDFAESGVSSAPFAFQYKGLYPAIDEATRVSYEVRTRMFGLVGEKECSLCGGSRVRDDAAAVRLREVTLPQLTKMPLARTLEYLQTLQLDKDEQKIAGDLLNEVVHRLRFLVEVGLDYLTLDRTMPTLSGGESQRIRLAGQIGRALTGVLYVLDEPTIGLHPRDNSRLIGALQKLRDLGNTVVLVEHDQEVIESADRLYDFGPGAGRFGGTITAEGAPRDLIGQSNSTSLTADYLSLRKSITIPTHRRVQRREKPLHPSSFILPPSEYEAPGVHWLSLLGARHHNLRSVDLHLPLGAFICVTGVSGSGKSSLILETLAPAVQRLLHRSGANPGLHDKLAGVQHLNKVVIVDQQPLGQTPASNPATYTGVWDPIRELFARLPESKIRGYRSTRFSFNRKGGRCEDCEGMGQKKIEMHVLPDVWVECTTCQGKRFNLETLAVTYKGRSISDVLQLSIGQALELFENIPKIRAPLATLSAIGLDYLTIGQSAPTLSGGEAQRVKLAGELGKLKRGKHNLYILDEPTTGLHFADIDRLLESLNRLVDNGHSVVVIEHNLDVIKTADHVIDLGPEGGHKGGELIACGTPEEIAACKASHTGKFLAALLRK